MPRKHGPYASVREAILATAAQLFTQQGVHGTSLGDIAAAADLSKGTLYYYYPAKEELVLTIGEGCLSHFTDRILAWVDGLRREEPRRPALLRLMQALEADEPNMRDVYKRQGESLRPPRPEPPRPPGGRRSAPRGSRAPPWHGARLPAGRCWPTAWHG